MPSGIDQHLQGDRKRNPQSSVVDQTARGAAFKAQRDLQTLEDELDLPIDASDVVSTGPSDVQTDIDALKGRATALETDVATAEGNITTLQIDLNTAEADITTLESDLNAVEAITTPLDGLELGIQTVVPTRTIAPFASGIAAGITVRDVYGVGPGSVEHNADLEYLFRNRYSGIMGAEGNPTTDAYFDWTNGNDSNNGQERTPYKTLQKALQRSGVGTIYMIGDSQEVIDADGADNTALAGTVARAMRVRSADPSVVPRFISPGQQPSEMSWTADGTIVNAYTATPSGGQTAEFLLFHVASATSDQLWNAREIPYLGASADDTAARALVGATITGWTQTAAGKLFVRFRDVDIDTIASRMTIRYASAGHNLRGLPVLFVGIGFDGGGGLLVPNSTDQPTWASRVYLKDCFVRFQANYGIDPQDDSWVVLQNTNTSRNAYDGIAPHDDSLLLNIDGISRRAGSRLCRLGVTNPARNRQGESTHDNAGNLSIGCDYRGNYGQNVADTGLGGTQLIGCDLRDPEPPSNAAAIVGFTALETYSPATYIDSCYMDGLAALFGWTIGVNGGRWGFRNLVGGTSGPGSGSIVPYNPYDTLPT